MSSLYSGNYLDLRRIIKRIEEDLSLKVRGEMRPHLMVESMRITTHSGFTICERHWYQTQDADIMCNEQIEWLRQMYSQLSIWN